MTDTTARARLKLLAALPLGLLGLSAATGPQANAMEQKNQHQQQLDELLAFKHEADARAQITEVLHRYARGWDRRDEDALRSCFHADSTHEHGGFKGLSQDFIGGGLKSTAAVLQMSHLITNVMIEVNGTRAMSECYFLAHHRRPVKDGDGYMDWFLKGRYLDRHEQRDGIWKISHRQGLSDFARTFSPADSSLDNAPQEQLSAHKPDDALYTMLSAFHAGQ